MRFALSLCGLMAVGMFTMLATPRQAMGDDGDATWVTSIAALDGSGQFVATTANGLLLREASVVRFEADNPSQLTPLYQHPAAVWRVVVLGDGQRLASVDYRGNLIVYDVESKQAKSHEQAFKRWCQTMIAGPDGKSLVAGNEAGEILVWDLAKEEISSSVELDEHAVTGLALSPDGSQLAATDGGGHVHLLSWPKLESIGIITIGEETAWCVAYTDEGRSLLVGSADRQLYSTPAEPDAEAKPIWKGTDWITQIAISPSGEVAIAEIGGRIRFPSAGESGEPLTAESGVWGLSWNGSAQLLVGTRKNGIVSAGRSWAWLPAEASDRDQQ